MGRTANDIAAFVALSLFVATVVVWADALARFS
jgi:hypothetical protein